MLKVFTICLLFPFTLFAQEMGTITFHVVVPEHTPNDSQLTLGSSINGWTADNKEYQFKLAGKLLYSFTTPSIEVGSLVEYKITRNSWETVEVDNDGLQIVNREITVAPGDNLVAVTVAEWADFKSKKPDSTVTGEIIIEQITLPLEPNPRNIRIFLPPKYKTNKQRYPVIYMTDAKALFDKATDGFDEWKMDETMQRLGEANSPLTSIIVAIDNAETNRVLEYNPFNFNKTKFTDAGVGVGDKFADYIALTLKPDIDKRYRTIPSSQHTMIMGSSMGGLISLYTGIKHQQVFSRIAGLSSAVMEDFIGNQFLDFINQSEFKETTRIYFDMGDKEISLMGKNIFADNQRIYDALIKKGIKHTNIQYKIISGGRHDQKSWGDRSEKILGWLYNAKPNSEKPKPGKLKDTATEKQNTPSI